MNRRQHEEFPSGFDGAPWPRTRQGDDPPGAFGVVDACYMTAAAAMVVGVLVKLL